MELGQRKGFAYWISQLIGRHIMWASLQTKVIRPDAADREGPYILALTHLSHLDPFLASFLVRRRPIDWLARVEFFEYGIVNRFMNAVGAIRVRRFGVSASAFRIAMSRLDKGRIVGICPEGGVAQGKLSVMRGAPMKQGVCLLSHRTGVPILPCIMLGTDKLNCVRPWIPFRRGNLYVAFDDRLLTPPPVQKPQSRTERRAIWAQMAADLSARYQALFQETLTEFNVPESFVPLGVNEE